MHRGQNLIEMLGNVMEIFQGELTLSKLAVTKDIIDQPIHHPLDSCRSRVIKRAAGRFDNISQHDQAGFFGLGFGAGIAIIVNVYGRQFAAL